MNWWNKQKINISINYKRFALLSLFSVFFLLTYLFNLMGLGPEYDELLNMNAALNCPSNVFIEKVFWINGSCVPLMVSPYIGGISSFFYRIIFLLVPGSVLSLRMINVVMVLLSFFFFYLGIKNIFSKKIAVITSFLLLFDFQLFRNIRYEGSSPVPFLLKAIFFCSISLFYETKSKIYLLISTIIIGLNVWAKFDNLFFYIALLIPYIYIQRKNILNFLKERNKLFLTLLGLFIGFLPLMIYFGFSFKRFLLIGSSIGRTNLFSSIIAKIELLFYQQSSFDSIWYIFRHNYSIPIFITTITVLFWIFYILAIKDNLKSKKYRFLSISIVVFFITFLVYGGLISAHHRFLIYPLPQIVLSLYLVKQKSMQRILFFTLFFILFLYSYYLTFNLSKSIGSVGAYSKNIYSISKIIDSTNSEILIGDWGIATQLVLLSKNPKNIYEVAFESNYQNIGDISESTKNRINNCQYLLLHSPNQVIFKNADYNLRTLISAKLIYTDSVYELYECN